MQRSNGGKLFVNIYNTSNIRWKGVGASKQKFSKAEVFDFDIGSSPVHIDVFKSNYFKTIQEKVTKYLPILELLYQFSSWKPVV